MFNNCYASGGDRGEVKQFNLLLMMKSPIWRFFKRSSYNVDGFAVRSRKKKTRFKFNLKDIQYNLYSLFLQSTSYCGRKIPKEQLCV